MALAELKLFNTYEFARACRATVVVEVRSQATLAKRRYHKSDQRHVSMIML
jgi:hypothetical protein